MMKSLSPERFRKLQEHQQKETEKRANPIPIMAKNVEKCLLCVALQIFLLPS